MKIAIVHSFYRSNVPSGENAAVLNQVNLLKDAGHNVLLIRKDSDEVSKMQSLRIALDVSTFNGASPLDAILEFSPDIVHIHNTFPNFGQRWIDELKIPHVITLHNFRSLCAAGTLSREGNDCFECPEQGSQRAIAHNCYRESKIATIPLALASRKAGANSPLLRSGGPKIVLSDFAREIYSKYNSRPNELHVLTNFAERTSEPSSINSPTHGRHWVFIGRLSQEKGIMELLQAWPDSEKIHVYGSGPLEDKLRAQFSQKLNIEFKGTLESTQRGLVLKFSNGLIFPSVCRENSPLVIGEAYSAGIPVIAYKGNVVGESIAKFGGGAVFEGFSELPAVLSSFDSIREVQLQIVRNIYETQYSPEVWISEILKIYRSVIDDHATE